MRFKSYLITEGRSVPISEDDALEYIRKKCSKYTDGYEYGTIPKIYRGLNEDTPYLKIDPEKFTRSSVSYGNYVTLLIDNLPAWKKYPKRSKSIICTTDIKYTRTFGYTTYLVYPTSNAKIGIVNNYDIWLGFTNRTQKNGVPDINRNIMAYTKGLTGSYNDKDWSGFVSSIKKSDDKLNSVLDDMDKQDKSANRIHLDKIAFVGNLFKKITTDPLAEKWINDEIAKGNKIDLMKWLKYIIDPKANGFSTKLYNMHRNKEVWISGECILMKVV